LGQRIIYCDYISARWAVSQQCQKRMVREKYIGISEISYCG
jgi:hypothetical protein